MKEKLKIPDNHSLYIMIDGCSRSNPGKGGAGIAFLSKQATVENQT